METHGLLAELLLLIAIAAAGVAVFERLGLPAIAGFLVMGSLVGPGGLGLVDDPERVRALAEFGVVFLLFEIGLELPLERLQRLWRRAVAAGGLQVAVTLLCAAGVAYGLGLSWKPALVIGALVTMSSTALVLRLLADRGEVDAPQGQLSVGILLFQDLCIVPFLLLTPLLAAGDAPSLGDAALALGRSAAGLIAFLVVARFALPRLLDRVAHLRSRDLFSLLAFLVVLGSAVVAEAIGLTLAVGAFLGGLLLSASPYAHQLFAEVVPLRGVLVGLFFTAVGMLFDPHAAGQMAPQVLGYIGGVIVLKTAVVAVIVGLVLRQGLALGVVAGLGLAQTGEFSFVLAAVAADSGLLDARLQQIFIAGSVGTLIATPFLMNAAPRLADWIARGTERLAREPAGEQAVLSNHAVLVGFGLAGQQVARVLRARRVPYVGVEANARAVQDLRARDEPVLYGDASRPAILERLGLARARLVVVAITDPLATRAVVSLARRLAPGATILARTRWVAEVDPLYSLGANLVVAEEFESSIELLAHALQSFGVPDGAIARFTGELREEGYTPMRTPAELPIDPWLSELLEQVSPEWLEVPQDVGGEASLVDLAIRPRTGVSVLAVDRDGELTSNPEASFAIQPGDRLLVFGSQEALGRLRALFERGFDRREP